MELTNADLVDGHISRTCYVRPAYNFSADEAFIESRFGRLKPDKLKAVIFTRFTVLTKLQCSPKTMGTKDRKRLADVWERQQGVCVVGFAA